MSSLGLETCKIYSHISATITDFSKISDNMQDTHF
jgi:hypothetical protein